MERRVFEVMLLAKTKIQIEAYLHNRMGYNITCSEAHPSRSGGYQGVIGLVTRERPNGWGIESMRFHGTNVVSCEIFTGHTRTPIVGAYLPPSTLEHLPDLYEALQHFKGM